MKELLNHDGELSLNFAMISNTLNFSLQYIWIGPSVLISFPIIFVLTFQNN